MTEMKAARMRTAADQRRCSRPSSIFPVDGLHIPKNGDEYPYEHIARLTAASGHFLPLQSELFEMRNTKPPLLFWQGIVGFSAWLAAVTVSGKGLIGAGFLAFFSTYRFGRPF
jgi:hypothetical protein